MFVAVILFFLSFKLKELRGALQLFDGVFKIAGFDEMYEKVIFSKVGCDIITKSHICGWCKDSRA